MDSNLALALQNLQDISAELRQATEPQGLKTGFPALDSQLFGQGIPRGVLSLFINSPGLGATSLWLETYRRLQGPHRAGLWISQETRLYAPALLARGYDLQSLYIVQPTTTADRQFVLREALETGVFTLVGCETGSLWSWHRSLAQLKSLVRKAKCGFVIISSDPRDLRRTHEFGFVAELKSDRMEIHKSKNRPAFAIDWRGSHAHLLPEFSSTLPAATGRGLSALHAPVVQPPARRSLVR